MMAYATDGANGLSQAPPWVTGDPAYTTSLWSSLSQLWAPTYKPSVPAQPPAGATIAPSNTLRELNRLTSMIQDGLARARGTSLEARGRHLAFEHVEAFLIYRRDPERASRVATDLTLRVHAWLRDVGNATVGGQAAFEAARSGASFTTQVKRTISEPIASAVASVSPAAAEVVRSAGWVLPVAGGLLLFLLIRR